MPATAMLTDTRYGFPLSDWVAAGKELIRHYHILLPASQFIFHGNPDTRQQ
jgi:hypothetical protein